MRHPDDGFYLTMLLLGALALFCFVVGGLNSYHRSIELDVIKQIKENL